MKLRSAGFGNRDGCLWRTTMADTRRELSWQNAARSGHETMSQESPEIGHDCAIAKARGRDHNLSANDD